MIHIRKQEGVDENKVNASLVSIYKCKRAYFALWICSQIALTVHKEKTKEINV